MHYYISYKILFKFTYKRYALVSQLLVRFGLYNENHTPDPIVHRCHLLPADKNLLRLLGHFLTFLSKSFLIFS